MLIAELDKMGIQNEIISNALGYHVFCREDRVDGPDQDNADFLRLWQLVQSHIPDHYVDFITLDLDTLASVFTVSAELTKIKNYQCSMISELRKRAYIEAGTDGLMAQYLADEITKQEWEAARDAAKNRYPWPGSYRLEE